MTALLEYIIVTIFHNYNNGHYDCVYTDTHTYNVFAFINNFVILIHLQNNLILLQNTRQLQYFN